MPAKQVVPTGLLQYDVVPAGKTMPAGIAGGQPLFVWTYPYQNPHRARRGKHDFDMARKV